MNFNCLKSFEQLSLVPKLCNLFSKRSHVILKRKFPLRLHRNKQPPKIFRTREYVYEVVKYTQDEKKPNIDVILTSYVEGVGQPGDEVSVRPFAGYDKLLVPGLAVYATAENREKYAGLAGSREATVHSSKFSAKTLKMLRYRVVGVPMNDSHPWTLEPWHIRSAFRLSGFMVPDFAIQMPPRAITGPHKEQHRKEFYVTVTISETERTKVRCRIHLTGINSDPVHQADWIDPAEPLFEEDREILDSMPKTSELPYIEDIRVHFNRF